jgi:hypothetical protein
VCLKNCVCLLSECIKYRGFAVAAVAGAGCRADDRQTDTSDDIQYLPRRAKPIVTGVTCKMSEVQKRKFDGYK